MRSGQVCHIGDALAPEATIGGGFAGIVVDLFADGALLSCLNEAHTPVTPPLLCYFCSLSMLEVRWPDEEVPWGKLVCEFGLGTKAISP